MASVLDPPIHGYSKQGDLVVLHGLVGEVDLVTVRATMQAGTLKPFPDCKVKDDLTSIAKFLHEHLKLTPEYRARVRTGETPVIWFICAVHRIMAPRSDSFADFPEGSQNAPLEQYSAMPPWYKDVDLNEPEKIGECNLPDLDPTDTLPLSLWDGVFYAVAAEIKFLYTSLQHRYGAKFEQGDTVLHNHGHDGNYGRRLFTVYDFAQQLERCWDRIMNPLLYAAIDFAMKQRAAFLVNGDIPTLSSTLRAPGLEEIDLTEPDQVFQSLALKQAPDMKVAVRRDERPVKGLADARISMDKRRREVTAQRKAAHDTLAAVETELSTSRAVTPTPPKLSTASPSDKALFQKDINSSLRGTKATKSLPVFDDSRPLLATPPEKGKAAEQEMEDDSPTLKATQRHAKSLGATAVPERAAIHRSNTESAGQVPFGAFNPLDPVKRSINEQRYVPAGGNTPLHERTVIGNPEFPREHAEQGRSFSANKEELWAAIDAKRQIDEYARKGEEAGKSSGERRGSRLKRFFSSSNKSSNNE